MSTWHIARTAAEAKLAKAADLRMPSYGYDCQSFERGHRNPSRERLLT